MAPRKRKDEAACWFWRHVPKTNEWRKRQFEVGLYDEQQYEDVIRAFTGRTKPSLLKPNCQRSFDNFQALICLSYCLVLQKKGIPSEVIDQNIQNITNAREVDRRRLLCSAQHINHIIVDLSNHGWTIFRATELFFISAFSLTNLTYLGDGQALQPIIEYLKSDEYVSCDYGDCLRPQYSIPGIIECLLEGNNITTSGVLIDDICAVLGYNKKDEIKSISCIFRVDAALRSTEMESVNLEFNILNPSSFQSDERPQNSHPLENLTLDRQSPVTRVEEDSRMISPFSYHANSSVAPISELLHNITVYFKNTCRHINIDPHGALLAPNGDKVNNEPCNDFDSYCFTATMFMQKGLYVESRCALSKASALVERILRAEHPRTLACFLEVFIHLIQTKLSDVAFLLRRFIKEMSAKVLRKGHPWRQICWLLGELDSESLEQAMATAWKCTTDIFDRELGPANPLAVSSRLDYIKRVHAIENFAEEELLLRKLLAGLGKTKPSTPRVMLNLAHNLNRQGRHEEAEEIALKVLRLLQTCSTYAWRTVERIECLKIVSHSQFNQGMSLEAERTMQQAIQMIVGQLGTQHAWVFEFHNVLEGWLRSWGREEDANALQGELKDLMEDNTTG